MNCPHCHSPKTQKDGQRQLQTGQRVQGYRCTACKKRFNERTGTPMSRLRTPQAVIETALKARSEGLGVRATARVLDKSHNSISKWESRLAAQESKWSPTRVRLRWSSLQTPAMALGFTSRAVSIGEMLSLRSFQELPP